MVPARSYSMQLAVVFGAKQKTRLPGDPANRLDELLRGRTPKTFDPSKKRPRRATMFGRALSLAF
jgi:hypothetical protein